MVGNGEMDLIYAHLLSLGNFNLFKERALAAQLPRR
jgi:hypothetical protein